jgi:hypothetical protein
LSSRRLARHRPAGPVTGIGAGRQHGRASRAGSAPRGGDARSGPSRESAHGFAAAASDRSSRRSFRSRSAPVCPSPSRHRFGPPGRTSS